MADSVVAHEREFKHNGWYTHIQVVTYVCFVHISTIMFFIHIGKYS